MSGHPPRSGGATKPSKHTPIPTEWRIELPDSGASGDAQFGGCRSIEAGYKRGDVLGQGTYGEVFLCSDLKTGDKVAAKKIKMDNEKEGFPITAIREIKILSALANATEELGGTLLRNNVIGLREIVRSGSHRSNNFKGSIYMVFDYMDHDMTGLLERSQREGRKFNTAQIKCYLRQLFCGLALLANHDVLHRDLKNANLLVNNKGELKIADFGLARYFHKRGEEGPGGMDSRMTNRVITLWYRPPELFLGCERYGTEIDMWSAGCIMFELLTGKPLFPGKDETDQVSKIFSIMGQPTEATMPGCTRLPHYETLMGGGVINNYPQRSRLRQHCQSRGVSDMKALDLLERLLALNPQQRINATQACTNPYFFSEPLPCAPSAMPVFESSHEMAMKRQRHEQRYGAQQQRHHQQQAPQQYQQQQQRHQGAGPPAQRQRTQGQYTGPQQQPYRGGGGGAQQPVSVPGQQQPYRGGGGGGAPAAGAMGAGGMGMAAVPGGAPGIMPGAILTQAQVQMMAQQGMLAAAPMGMVPPGMLQQQQAGMAGGGSYGYGTGQPGRPLGGGMPGGQGARPYGGPTSGGMAGGHPHRMGGGAEPNWQNQRR